MNRGRGRMEKKCKKAIEGERKKGRKGRIGNEDNRKSAEKSRKEESSIPEPMKPKLFWRIQIQKYQFKDKDK